ncbi:MAG: FKBP-type peptidyl-prolyl cis-trans isomerase [Geobacter sp.]|nr:FKBP-type peptidyl-prolyl cis-trans isomerase [Geobacter sp.]
MKRIRNIAALTSVAAILSAAPAFAKQPETEEQKTLYAIGQVVAKQLSVFTLSSAELEWVQSGITDGVKGEVPAVDMQKYNEKVQELAKSRRNAMAEKKAAANKEYLVTAANEKGAVKSDSGLIYTTIKEGTGASPKATDNVKVHYKGTLVDGKEFDSSYKRGTPLEFPLNNVIKCWTEGVQKMKAGGKAKLVCPASIAYGDRGQGEILPGATLIFEVELLDVVKK